MRQSRIARKYCSLFWSWKKTKTIDVDMDFNQIIASKRPNFVWLLCHETKLENCVTWLNRQQQQRKTNLLYINKNNNFLSLFAFLTLLLCFVFSLYSAHPKFKMWRLWLRGRVYKYIFICLFIWSTRNK